MPFFLSGGQAITTMDAPDSAGSAQRRQSYLLLFCKAQALDTRDGGSVLFWITTRSRYVGREGEKAGGYDGLMYRIGMNGRIYY